MSTQPTQRDPWRWPALLLWGLFFLLGLWPELSFNVLRAAGYVFSQNAVINSYNFITWALTGFIAHFVYQRCLETTMPPLEALGKSIQLGVVAFVAFLDMPLAQIPDIRNTTGLVLVLGMVLIKLLAWLYLYVLLIRYHWKQEPELLVQSLPWLALTAPERVKNNDLAEKDVDTAHTSSSPSMEKQAD